MCQLAVNCVQNVFIVGHLDHSIGDDCCYKLSLNGFEQLPKFFWIKDKVNWNILFWWNCQCTQEWSACKFVCSVAFAKLILIILNIDLFLKEKQSQET